MISTNFDTLSVFQSGGRIFAADLNFCFSTPCKFDARSVDALSKIDPILADHEDVHIDFQVDEDGLLHERDIFTDVQSSVLFSPHIEWRTLSEHALEGLEIVRGFTQGPELFTGLELGVHLAPDFIEGTDSHQIARYDFPTGLTESVYLNPLHLRYVSVYGLNQFAVTEDWIHFRNNLGTMLSLRKLQSENYENHDLGQFLTVDGPQFLFPANFVDAVDRLSRASNDGDVLGIGSIEISDGLLSLSVNSPCGLCEESFQIDYAGQSLKKSVRLPLLSDLAKHSESCSITKDRLVGINDRLKIVIGLFEESEASNQQPA